MKELVALIFSISVISACGAAKSSLESVQSGGTAQMDAAAADSGTLHVSTINPRYFTDSSGKPIYLMGSHTWTGLIDRGAGDRRLVSTLNVIWISFRTPITTSYDCGAVM